MEVAEKARIWTDQERMTFLLEAARQVGSTLDEQRIYQSLQRLIAEKLPLDGFVVSSFDPSSELIVCEHAWSDGAVLDTSEFPPIRWNRDGTGMQSKIIRTAKAEIFDVPRKVSEPNTTYVEVGAEGTPAPVTDEPAAKSAMMAPMILDGVVTGVIQVMSDQPHAYSEDDLDVFEALTVLVTPAWHHARTYQLATRETHIKERILDTSPDIVYVFDLRTWKIEFSNGQLERQLGYGGAEVAGMDEETLFTVMHPEDAARLPELLARYQGAGDDDLFESEWRVAAKDGGWRWFLNRARVFERDEAGRAIRILGFATDVTDKREAEAKHRESEERYRFLAEKGGYIVWTAGGDGAVDYVNGPWREYFGFDPTTEVRPDGLNVLHPDDREVVHQGWVKAVSSGNEYECEARLRRADGEFRWHLCRATSVLGSDGAPAQWFGISIDIHDQKEIEAALEARVQERTAELEAAVKELEGFTYSVSHDLRGPLRAISAASMIIREDFSDKLPEEALKHLLRQAEASKKMGTLIDDLLKLSRIGRQELTPSPFDLSEMAADVSRELGASDRVEVQPSMEANGDPRLIRFVLLNLVENAIKFSPAGGAVKVARENGAFCVSDGGIGFQMEYAEKLFRPFERLVRDEEYPGTGIGLANVQRIIQRHGGKVWAESEPGKGARFYFTLPTR